MSWIGSKASARRGDPNYAALLTWFVPGAGHLMIGMPVVGLCVFALVECLYFAGMRLTDGMVFEFLQPDLRSPVGAALTPEAGNLGAMIWHMRSHGFGPGFPRPWPEHMIVGAWLTAISGLLNVCAMVHAHCAARTLAGQPLRLCTLPALHVLLGWLLPGLGHFAQGRKLRGSIVCALLVGTFVLGTLLAEGSNLDRERHFYYWGAQFLVGAPSMLLEVLHGHAPVTGEIPYLDAGLVFAGLAGLLNVLALIDVFSWSESRAGLQDSPARDSARSGVPA